MVGTAHQHNTVTVRTRWSLSDWQITLSEHGGRSGSTTHGMRRRQAPPQRLQTAARPQLPRQRTYGHGGAAAAAARAQRRRQRQIRGGAGWDSGRNGERDNVMGQIHGLLLAMLSLHTKRALEIVNCRTQAGKGSSRWQSISLNRGLCH